MEQPLPALGSIPPGVEIVGEPARPFDAEHPVDIEARFADLAAELVRMMEVASP